MITCTAPAPGNKNARSQVEPQYPRHDDLTPPVSLSVMPAQAITLWTPSRVAAVYLRTLTAFLPQREQVPVMLDGSS